MIGCFKSGFPFLDLICANNELVTKYSAPRLASPFTAYGGARPGGVHNKLMLTNIHVNSKYAIIYCIHILCCIFCVLLNISYCIYNT